MMNFLLTANLGKVYVEQIIKSTNGNDLRITEILCIAGDVAIFIICVTICLLMIFKKDISTKRILEKLLKNDNDIAILLKEKITVSNTEDAIKEVLNDMIKKKDSDFIKRVSEEVHRLNTEDAIKKEVLNDMIKKKDSDFIRRVSEEVHRLNTEDAIKEVLNDMIDKEDSELIKNIKDKL